MRRMMSRHATAAAVVAMCAASVPATAQTTTSTPPVTQDQELRRLLGLGDANGCVELLRLSEVSQQAVADELARLGPELGNELRAICGPSAVASASSLGGGLQSLQAIKTVTQFRVARARIDQRLKPPPPKPVPKPPKFAAMAWQAAAQRPADLPVGGRGSVFGEVEFATRNRTDTAYESGYESDVRGFVIGADATNGRVVGGGWFGVARQEGDFTRFSAIFDDDVIESFPEVLGDPEVLSSVCGGLQGGGTLEQRATRVGGFVGWRVGRLGFMDVAGAWTRRQHEYARNVCAIEAGTLSLVDDVLFSDNAPADDIYAGTLFGDSAVQEIGFSFRVGADAGNDRVTVSPRAVITYTRATAEAYIETGQSTIDIPVVPNIGPTIQRQIGGPIGFELAFDEQRRSSLLLEAGGEIAAHAGQVSPFFFGYWRQELMDEFPTVTARFAQDLRQMPSVLEFGFDAYDPRAFRFGFGVTAVGGDRMALRVELSRLVSDLLFSGQTVSIQARVGF